MKVIKYIFSEVFKAISTKIYMVSNIMVISLPNVLVVTIFLQNLSQKSDVYLCHLLGSLFTSGFGGVVFGLIIALF